MAILVGVTDQLQRQRRRGEELESALLNAAWDELAEAGFARLTMESVAVRARTGVAVLAAIANYGKTRPIPAPDTGTLRGDMHALLTSVNEGRSAFTVIVSAAFAGLLSSTGLTPAEVRAKIMGDRPLWSHEVFRRAHERGELDLDTIPGAILAMPFDLIRHDL